MAEMLSVAQNLQAAQPRAPHPQAGLARGVQTALGGVQAGIRGEQERRAKEFERMLKVIKISETLKDIETKELNNRIAKNIAKSFGIIGMDDNELDIARQVGNNAIGVDADKALMGADKTKKGKMNILLDDMKKKAKFSTKGGFEITYEERDDKKGVKGRGTAATNEKRIWDLARQMAILEERDVLEKKGDYEWEKADFRSYVPQQHIINKYLPVARAYLAGDTGYYKNLLKKAREKLDLPAMPDLSDLEIE